MNEVQLALLSQYFKLVLKPLTFAVALKGFMWSENTAVWYFP